MSDLKIFAENIEGAALNQIYTLAKTPGCSCDGYEKAVEDVKWYRDMALQHACDANVSKTNHEGFCCYYACTARRNGGYCDDVIKVVDR